MSSPLPPSLAERALGALPVDLYSADRAGGDRSLPEAVRTEAQRYAASERAADHYKRRLAAGLLRARAVDPDHSPGLVRTPAGWQLACEPTAEQLGARPWVAVRKLDIRGYSLKVEGREVRPEWWADPVRASAALAGCSAAWGVHLGADGWGEHPYACGCGICPSCQRRAAARRARTWAPVIEELAARGYRVVSLTLTQRQMPGDPSQDRVLLSDEEQARLRYTGLMCNEEHPEGVSTPGEGIAASIERLTHSWALLRDGAAREWWQSTIAGAFYGIESTPGVWKDGRWRLRWHTHLHALLVLRPDAEIETYTVTKPGGVQHERVTGPWWRSLIKRWREVSPLCNPQAQQAQLVKSTDERSLYNAVCETLKYPVKLGEMTDAQIADWLASTKGRRWHERTGSVHGSSRVCTVARWAALGGASNVGNRLLALDAAERVDELLGLQELDQVDEFDQVEEQLQELLATCSAALQELDTDHGAAASTQERARRAWGRLEPGDRQLARDLAWSLVLAHVDEERPAVAFRPLSPEEEERPPVRAIDGRTPLTRAEVAGAIQAGAGDIQKMLYLQEEPGEWSIVYVTPAEVWADLVRWKPPATLTPGGIPDGSADGARAPPAARGLDPPHGVYVDAAGQLQPLDLADVPF